MNKNIKILLFLIFVLSGLSGLVYQSVWIRLAFGSFGCITPVMSVAISVFMLGIAIGSWFGGKYIDKLSDKLKISPIYFYILTEIFIATGALIVPNSFIISQHILLDTGATNSFTYLLLSAIVLTVCLLPWCIAMGTTFPFMMSFLKKIYKENTTGFSFLYTANVIGGMLGVLATTIIWIEVYGFKGTLSIACCGNIFAALLAFIVYKLNRIENNIVNDIKTGQDNKVDSIPKQLLSEKFIFIISFITGFTTLSLEIVWTRAYSPVLGTMVYSFSFLLAGYLFATWLGSFLYRKDLERNRVKSPVTIVALTSLFVFLPIKQRMI